MPMNDGRARQSSEPIVEHGARKGLSARSRITLITALACVIVSLGIAGPATAGRGEAKTWDRTGNARPQVVGKIQVGEVLRVRTGTWPRGTTFTYRWRADSRRVPHATKKQFALTTAQVGHTISVSVTGHRAGHPAVTRSSRSTPIVPPASFSNLPIPSIGGSPSFGSTLSAQAGTWGPPDIRFAYQWLSDGVPIGGATSPQYVVESANIGQALSVSVTGHARGYVDRTVLSAATTKVPVPPVTGRVATRTQRMTQSTLNSTQEGWYENGQVLTLSCYQRGQSVQGYFSSSFPNGGWDNLWYRVDDGHYVADVDLETGTLDPVVPACADQPVADTTNARVMATTQRMSSATLNSTQDGVYTAGSRLTLTCFVHGQPVKGYYSSSFPGGYDDLWYQVNDGHWVADVDLQTGSNDPVTPGCSSPPPAPANNDLTTRAKSWLDARVPYDQGSYYTNQYGKYRQDCSGFVSMALGLPSSYTTVTLPQVMHPIGKDDLRPGDFMLNSASGNNGHVAIFMGWTDSSRTHYVSWEENGVQGYTFSQVVPYPYWSSWSGSSNYKPYRRN
ncbi:hypothetical protein H5V45_14020 [Nocardioides sp. KIGAM211]|uniref:NlpC/P60 domain-containing protein n=1 Tax=Nocardioides luti TaxID=2761101 RepID=A0A7X0VB41_9ACTN|nr:hypothetical protein [Nocardioides luti]MBB6628439.1 hypothetical protein [Nocardioides luti]